MKHRNALRATIGLTWLVAGLVVAGCGPAAGPDAASAQATPALNSARVVTMGGPLTEIVYALGYGDRIVGADISSLYPPDILEKPRLGYFRQASAEGILSVHPTLVLALDGLGPPAVADQLRAAGVEVWMEPEAHTIEAARDRIERMGRILGVPDRADSLLARIEADLNAVAAPIPGIRVLFVYARGAGLVQVSGSGTPASEVLELAGLENALPDIEGFTALTAEAVVTAAPDLIVMPERGLASLGGWEGLLAQPGIAQTPAGQNQRIVTVDDALLLGLGPRIGQGIQALAEAVNQLGLEPASL